MYYVILSWVILADCALIYISTTFMYLLKDIYTANMFYQVYLPN